MARGNERRAGQPGIDKTLSKGLRLVEMLGKDGRSGISDLAARSGMTKSNVHRLLQTLMRAGWARKVPGSSGYELSSRAWEVAQNWIARFDLPRFAGPYLAKLAAATLETVHLAVLDGADVVFMATINAPRAIRTYTPLGSRAPAHRVATGKAILAFLPPEQLPAFPERLARLTRNGAATRAELLRELERARERGYAANRAEWQEGVNGLAAPVFAGAGGPVVASIGLSGPADRLNAAALRRFLPQVLVAAKATTHAIAEPGTGGD
jgi:DNA-binding IclR family transcriptional regulator